MVGLTIGLAVGGWFASAAISKLADKVRDYISDNYEYQKNVMKKLRSLDRNLMKIQSVIHVTEQRMIDNPSLVKWLSSLKDATYDAEDVLDLFEYLLLKEKIEGENQVRSDFISICCKKIKIIGTVVKCFFFAQDDRNDLWEVAERFDKITAEMIDFVKLVDFGDSTKQDDKLSYRLTTSLQTEFEVFGRNKEIKHIIELLVETSSSCRSNYDNKFIHVVPIVGIGGVGKTTLVQWVYHDQHVIDYFDLRVWVCVSERFDMKRVMMEILDSVSRESYHDFHNLNSLQETLKRKLMWRRYLIVLDDVWNEVGRHWEILRSPLKFGKEGSRVIITTRNEAVANMMGTMKPFPLCGLEYEDLWNFFAKCAFGDENREDHPKLVLIGRRIVEKLGGSPLAAKTVGAVLKSKLEEKHWRNILEVELCKIQQDEDGIIPALKLSYENLPAPLKQCFVYCSLFPKSYRFKKDKLIRIWIAQGFVQPNDERRMEDIGGEYFDELTQRYFFERETDYYMIHDLLHDLAMHISDGEYFRITGEGTIGLEIPKRVRHLYVESDNFAKLSINKHEMKKLRSLVVVGHCDPIVLSASLKEMRGLRVLILHRLSVQRLPSSIDKLLHLRYLELRLIRSTSRTTVLPESLGKLYNLQALHLEDCGSLLGLPKEISNLINLRYLSADRDMVSDISEIGRLTSLQELEFYIVKQETGHKIGQLMVMTQLRGRLCIQNLENIGNEQEARKANLKNKKHLESLQLEWCGVLHSHEVLDALQPHQNLRRLTISGYNGIQSPCWLETKWLSNLEHIKLWDCSRWDVLPPLGQLPFLKVLHLGEMRGVEQISHEFYGNEEGATFPSLEELSFQSMRNWKVWSRVEDRPMFPRLTVFRISDCPRLKGPINLSFPLMQLEQLEICHSHYEKERPQPSFFGLFIDNISLLTKWLPSSSLSSLQELTLSFLLDFASFTSKQENWFRHLTSLRKLEFYRCIELQSLPTTLISLSALRVLMIEGCSQIQSLPETGLPGDLRVLHIKNCHEELLERCKENGSDWNKIRDIPKVDIHG